MAFEFMFACLINFVESVSLPQCNFDDSVPTSNLELSESGTDSERSPSPPPDRRRSAGPAPART
jgi:hypothetical protein